MEWREHHISTQKRMQKLLKNLNDFFLIREKIKKKGAGGRRRSEATFFNLKEILQEQNTNGKALP